MRLIVRGVVWFGLYFLMIAFPLVAGAIFIEPARSPFFLVNLSIAFGYIGMALMAAELALVSRFEGAAGAFGQDALLQFHREMGIASLVLVTAHPILLFATSGYTAKLLSPFDGTPWPVWMGTVAFITLCLVVGLSIFRRRLSIPYEMWQFTHGLLSLLLIAFSAIHVATVGRFSTLPVIRAVWILYLVALVGMFFRYRVIRPLVLTKRPWEVTENRVELGDSRTIVLKPVGHPGFTFQPGQFGWVGFGRSPFSVTMHPISFSSNGDVPTPGGEVAFTIKALGDWSGKIVPAVQPGDRAWIDGPHGVFTMDREEGAGYVLIGGGVGITPLHSMVLAMNVREDNRPVILFYGANDEEDLTFRREFEALSQTMPNFKLVVVLVKPLYEWGGETGFITEDILRRHLPERLYKHFQYFICGPTPLMDAMEDVLPRIGVPAERIHTERFDMV